MEFWRSLSEGDKTELRFYVLMLVATAVVGAIIRFF